MMMESLPRKILMTADTIGGVWTYSTELIRGLQKYDIEVHLATMGKKLSPSQWSTANSLHNLIIRESSYDLEWMDHPWQDVTKAGEWLLELEQEIQPDLIHLNNYAHGSLAWNAPVVMVGHSDVLSWWNAVKGEEAPERYNTYAQKVREGLQDADCVVGVTQNMLKSLKNYYGPFSCSTVAYNGRDANNFKQAAKEPLIFSMGRLWDEAKNIAALQEIGERLSWPVYIAGEDKGMKNENCKNVHFMGQISSSEVVEWLSKASIFVMPARYEPFGLSALEAACSRCSLVLGDIPTLREVWKEAAMFTDPDDSAGLYHQIQTLITNAAKRQQMARKAWQRAQRFSSDLFAQRYISLYRQQLYAPAKEVAE